MDLSDHQLVYLGLFARLIPFHSNSDQLIGTIPSDISNNPYYTVEKIYLYCTYKTIHCIGPSIATDQCSRQ